MLHAACRPIAVRPCRLPVPLLHSHMHTCRRTTTTPPHHHVHTCRGSQADAAARQLHDWCICQSSAKHQQGFSVFRAAFLWLGRFVNTHLACLCCLHVRMRRLVATTIAVADFEFKCAGLQEADGRLLAQRTNRKVSHTAAVRQPGPGLAWPGPGPGLAWPGPGRGRGWVGRGRLPAEPPRQSTAGPPDGPPECVCMLARGIYVLGWAAARAHPGGPAWLSTSCSRQQQQHVLVCTCSRSQAAASVPGSHAPGDAAAACLLLHASRGSRPAVLASCCS